MNMSKNECKWRSKSKNFYYGCGENVLMGDTDSYCILHSKNEHKDLKDFTAKVTERIDKGEEKIDLRGCYFPEKFHTGIIKDYLKTLHDKVCVSFREATFSQQVTFERTFFREATFTGTKFLQRVYFSDSSFSKVYFNGTIFKKGVSFLLTEFKERATFLPYREKELEGITEVHFGGPSSFKYTQFPGEVIFENVDLSPCSFLHSNIDKVDFRYCTFGKKWPRQNVLRNERDLDAEAAGKGFDRKGYEPVRRLYLELKRNFEDKKDWNTAGDFHFGEMECRRKMRGWWDRNIFSLEALYFWISGYGESPWRTFLVLSIFVFGLFPVLYMPSEGWSYLAGLRDSVSVATLMRLGNPLENNPSGWKFIVALFEIILSPLLITLLALALRRKVKR